MTWLWPDICGAARLARRQPLFTSLLRSFAVRRCLVAAEMAISLVLAVATAMLVQSFRQVQQVDPGFATDHVLSMRVSLSATR